MQAVFSANVSVAIVSVVESWKAVVVFRHHIRPYLLGKQFTLRTDHGSLTWLWNFKEPEGQTARWIERLQEYDFSIVYRLGKNHANADALSRIPCGQCGPESHHFPLFL